MRKRARPEAARPRRKGASEEVALASALSRVESFVDVVDLRCEQARDRAASAEKGTPDAARALQDVEESWAELQSALRLRNTVAAAVASAEAQVAAIDAEATAVIGAAFAAFKQDRARRRHAADPGGARARARKPAPRARSPDELGELVAVAMEATVYVIADRNRLMARLVDTRTEAAALRDQLATAAAGSPEVAASLQRRLELSEEFAAELERALPASAAAAQQLLVGLRRLHEKLPDPAVWASARLRWKRALFTDGSN